ncbi:hypothetical protein N7451_006082 [Penicillium sp. IBT 35674x]|nr:hypothetical protein N7451_006082 [Penicillium sp. IBT 35674x]
MDKNFLMAEACDEKRKAPTTHLITLLDQVTYRFPDHDAIVSLHQTDTLKERRPLHWTFAQLQHMSTQLAARLSSKGVGHGSRLVTMMFNQAQWALLFCASARLGCHFVPLDPRVLDRDRHDVLSLLNQLEPAAMFVSTEAMSNRLDQIQFCQDHRPFVRCIVADDGNNMSAGWTTLSKIISEPLDGTPTLPAPGKPDDTTLILFTSGTTALPKGCPHSSISIGAQALGLMDHLDVGPGANLCQHLPNFHVFNVALTLAFWLAGATVSFPSPSFDPQSKIGEVHLGGLPVFGGYIGGSSVSSYREDGVNWIATGDQGYMDGEGYLYLLGRYKDLIIRGGENISPFRIEQYLEEVSGIKDACVIGIPDATAGEVPVAVIRKDPSTQAPKQTSIQMMILNELGASFAPARVLDLQDDLRKDTYPTTTSGKIQKAMLREWVMDHLSQVAVDVPASSNDLSLELTKIWSGITGLTLGQIDPDVSIRTFADSMMQIQFCHLIGQKLQQVIRQSDLINFNTIQKQAKLLEERKQRHAKDSHSHDTVRGLPMQLDMKRAKHVASSKLNPLGFGWDDVQEVIPISDCLKRSHHGFRPNSWNIRMSWISNSSITIAELQAALHTWLQRHPLLRSTPVTYNDELDLYLVMHLSADWMRLQVIDGGTVEDVNCVATYKLNDPEYDYLDRHGPLFRATILSVNDSSAVGMVMHLHHLILDAHILFRWFEDLRDLLNHEEKLLNFHPYSDYITDYHRHRSGATSQKAVDFHVDRIRGVSSAKDALWPPQIAPHWLKGDNQGWAHRDNTPGSPSERPLLDGDKSCGTKGISRAVLVPKILELQHKFAITPPIIAKCACALLNIRMTGAKEAIFGMIESGRTWPSADDNQPDKKEMEILEVDGPTITHCLNRTRIKPEETAIQLLTRMAKDQDDIVSHIYAPIDEICRKLDVSDETSFIDIVHRQSFNWIMGEYQGHASDPIKPIEAVARPDLGLSWLPGLSEGNKFRLTVSYDDAQLRATEVYNIMTEYLCAVAWLSNPANMDKNVDQCEFQSHDIMDLDREGPGRYRR